MHRPHGVTLIELIIAVSLLAILSMIAIPSFANLHHDVARTDAVNSFFHGLFLARSESMKRGQMVSICKSTDGQTCTASGKGAWQDGWIIFANDDRDNLPERDPEEALLLVGQAWPGGTITSNRAAYSFRPHSQAVVNGTIVFCDPRGSDHARAIIISHTGRPRVAKRDSSNKPLKCG